MLTDTGSAQPKSSTYRIYDFDKVFGQHTSQKEIFDDLQVSYLVKRVIEVRNCIKNHFFRVSIPRYSCMGKQGQGKRIQWRVTNMLYKRLKTQRA
jgi:hypothetical protein